jgi:pimeloyl-ACP methyl ester carboxylesterase
MIAADRVDVGCGMAIAERTATLPACLRALLARFDVRAFTVRAPEVRVRLGMAGDRAWDLLVRRGKAEVHTAQPACVPDVTLTADAADWARIASYPSGAVDAFRDGRLIVRRNLHVGIAFLTATNGSESGRLQCQQVETRFGRIALLTAGHGTPVLCLHGLGATKGSFLHTVAALGESFHAMAADLPGFGDSSKSFDAPYDPLFFARSIVELLNALALPRVHLIGNGLGARVALEVGVRHPERVARLVLLAPSLTWDHARRWVPLVRALGPELQLMRVTPRWFMEFITQRAIPVAARPWVRAGVDEFLRCVLTPRGAAAFYRTARQSVLEPPHGPRGFWRRLAELQPPALFVWGRRDWLVPSAVHANVRQALPMAQHLEVDCGHLPQLERPRETQAAIKAFLACNDTPASLDGMVS